MKIRVLITILIVIILFIGFVFVFLNKNKPISNNSININNFDTSSINSNISNIKHRIAFIGDSRGNDDGINKKVLTEIFKQLSELTPKPEYIVTGGDLVSGDNTEETFIKQLNAFKTVATKYFPINSILPVYGNHEDSGSTKKSDHEKIFGEFFSEFNKTSILKEYNNTVYNLDIDNIRLIILNSYHSGQTSQIVNEQYNWLFNNLNDKSKLKFVFLHSPAFPLGGHIGSSLDMYPEKRDAFWQALDKNNVMSVFCGHEHNYSRRIIDKKINPMFSRPLNQIVVGTAGADFNTYYLSKEGVIVPPVGAYHYLLIDICENETKYKAVSIERYVIDEFTLQNIY